MYDLLYSRSIVGVTIDVILKRAEQPEVRDATIVCSSVALSSKSHWFVCYFLMVQSSIGYVLFFL